MFNVDISGFRGRGTEVVGTAGATAKIAFTAGESSSAFLLANGDTTATYPIFVKVVARGASAPTVTAANFHLAVQPGDSRIFGWDIGGSDIYIFSAGTQAYTALPVSY